MASESRGRRRGGAARARSNADTIRIAGTERGLVPRRIAAREGVVAEGVAFPMLVGVVHWVIVQLVAGLAYHQGTLNKGSAPKLYGGLPLHGLSNVLVAPLRLWDGLWYAYIAATGYGDGMQAKAAFWPLFPWMMDAGHRLTGLPVETVGYLISNIGFLVALVLLYRLVSIDFERGVARRTLVAIAFFPTALFFSAVYTESLFLLTIVGALLAARRGNWWMAGLVGALAGLTRSYGVLLLLPFAVLFIEERGWNPRRWFPDAIAAIGPLLGPIIYGWHLDRTWGDPLAWSSTQAQWDRYGSNPIQTMRCAIEGCVFYSGISNGADWGWVRMLVEHPTWATVTENAWRRTVADSDTLELVVTVLFLGLALIGLRLLPLYMTALTIPGLLIPLYQPSQVHALMSIPRFGLTLFPLFIVLAVVLRHRRVAIPALALSTFLLVLLTAQFAQWYWVS